MRIETGPKFNPYGLKTEIMWAVPCINEALAAAGCDRVVYTSGCDRRHSRRSLHYKGYAVDLVPSGISQYHADAIKAVLGPHFDVVYEGDHIHVEYDPPNGVNLEP